MVSKEKTRRKMKDFKNERVSRKVKLNIGSGCEKKEDVKRKSEEQRGDREIRIEIKEMKTEGEECEETDRG